MSRLFVFAGGIFCVPILDVDEPSVHLANFQGSTGTTPPPLSTWHDTCSSPEIRAQVKRNVIHSAKLAIIIL